MLGLTWEQLTQEQQDAITDWHEANDPNQDQFDCVDNHRYAISGNAEHEAAYDEAIKNGCCGFVDVVLNLADGTVLLYGFNYGH